MVKIKLYLPESGIYNVYAIVNRLPSGFYHITTADGDCDDYAMIFNKTLRRFEGV